jgi:hypothetical protein
LTTLSPITMSAKELAREEKSWNCSQATHTVYCSSTQEKEEGGFWLSTLLYSDHSWWNRSVLLFSYALPLNLTLHVLHSVAPGIHWIRIHKAACG